MEVRRLLTAALGRKRAAARAAAITRSTQLDEWLDEVSKDTKDPQSGLALIILDIKTPDGPIDDLYHRVRNKLGPDINLMFSVGSFDGGTTNLGRLRDLLNADPRAGAAIDFLTGDETQDKVEAFFRGINMDKYWFADGLFAAGVVSVEKNVADGMALRDAETNCSAFHGVYTWTYEEEDAIQSYLNKGVNGIIVNTNACYQFVNPGGPEVITQPRRPSTGPGTSPGASSPRRPTIRSTCGHRSPVRALRAAGEARDSAGLEALTDSILSF